MSHSKQPSTTLKQRVHWPTVQRRPVRNMLAYLRSQTLSLPKDVTTVANNVTFTPDLVIKRLDVGETAAWRPAKGDKAKQKSVDDAQTVVDEVTPVIKTLGEVSKKKPGTIVQKLDVPVATEGSKTRSDDLIKLYMDLNRKILAAKTELMTIQLPPERDYNTLQSRIRHVELMTKDAVIDQPLFTLISQEIPPIETDFGTSLKEARAWPSERDRMTKVIDGYPAELKALKAAIEKLGGKAEEVAPDLFDTFQLRMRVSGMPASVKGVTKAFDDHETLMDQVRKTPADALAKTFVQQAAAANTVAAERKKVSTALGAKVETLRSLCDALGSSSPQLLSDYDTLLSQVGQPDSKGVVPDTEQEIAHLLSWIDDAIESETGKFETLRKETAKSHETALAAVKKARQASGTNPALTVDWKQLDGIVDAYAGQVDGTDMASPAAVRALIAAKVLDRQVLDRLAAMNDDKGALKPELAGFAASLKAIQDGLEDDKLAGEKSHFGILRASARTKLEAGVKTFVRDLPKLPGAQAAEQLGTLKKIYDETLKEADELAAAIELGNQVLEQRTTLYGTLKKTAKKKKAKWKSPNAASIAIATLKAALKKSNPDKDVIDAARVALETALKPTTTYDELIAGADVAVTAKAKAKSDKKDAGALLDAQLRQARSHLSTTESVVTEAGGDLLAVKAIKTLLDEAKGKVKARDASAAAALAAIIGRCDMLIAHPEGEANRARNELPKLFEEWQTLLNSVASELTSTVTAIKEYKPPQDSQDPTKVTNQVQKLCQQIEAYKVYFTAGGGQLAPQLSKLASEDTPEPGRRKAREAALAVIGNQAAALQRNPLTAMLASCPIGGASTVPGRLNIGLSRLQYTILTSVRN